MKNVTVREAQHNLARILQVVEGGEAVEIRRRKIPVARIVPISPEADANADVNWDGHRERMASLWGGTSLGNLDSVLTDLRGDR